MNIYDIAKKTGFSIATVSRVINGSANVKPATKEKIMAAINEENYRPNVFARGLSTDSAKLAGVLCTDISDAFYAKAVSLLQAGLNERGYTMLLGCTGDDVESKKQQINFMLEKHVDAIFLVGSAFCTEENKNYLAQIPDRLPLIMINGYAKLDNVYCVYCDDEAALADTVGELVLSGHKKIMYVYDALTPSALAKLSGYVRGLTENKISYNEDLVVRASKTIDGGRLAIENAISEKNIPDAVITSEDILAVGAMKALLNANCQPIVIGYNNSALCECTSPTLSSVDNRLGEMCYKSFEIFDELLADGTPSSRFKYTAKLVLRESFTGD